MGVLIDWRVRQREILAQASGIKQGFLLFATVGVDKRNTSTRCWWNHIKAEKCLSPVILKYRVTVENDRAKGNTFSAHNSNGLKNTHSQACTSTYNPTSRNGWHPTHFLENTKLFDVFDVRVHKRCRKTGENPEDAHRNLGCRSVCRE